MIGSRRVKTLVHFRLFFPTIFLLSLMSIGILYEANSGSNSAWMDYKVCERNSSCNSQFLPELGKYGNNLNFELTVKDLNGSRREELLLGEKSVHIKLEGSKSILYLPMQSGNERFFFPIELKLINGVNHELNVNVENSRVFVVKLNSELVYGHRYNEPVFFLGEIDSNALKNQMISLRFNIARQSEIQKGIQNVLVFLWLVLTFIFGTKIFSRFKLRYSISVINATKITYYFYLVFGLYLIQFSYWLLRRETNPNVVAWATDTPFAQAGPRFSDFYQIQIASTFDEPYVHQAVNYPQFALFFVRVLSVIPNPFGFVSISALCMSFLWIFFSRIPGLRVPQRILGVANFPILFALDRGNLELITIVILLIAITAKIDPLRAAILIGLASSIKVWPLLFIFFFIKRGKDLKYLLVAICTFMSMSLLGMAIYKGPIFPALATENLNLGTDSFKNSLSLKSLTGLLFAFFHGGDVLDAIAIANSNFIFLLRIFALISISGLMLLLKSDLARYTSLCTMILLLPSISFTYRLAITIPILVMLLEEESIKFKKPNRVLYFFLGVLSAPCCYYLFSNNPIGTDSVIYPLFIVFVYLIVVSRDLRNLFSASR